MIVDDIAIKHRLSRTLLSSPLPARESYIRGARVEEEKIALFSRLSKFKPQSLSLPQIFDKSGRNE